MEQENDDIHQATKGTGPGSKDPLFDGDAQGELIDTIGEDVFFSLLAALPTEAEGHLTEIRDAIECGDLPRARMAAHILNGVAANCTAIRIAAAARMIEQHAVANTLVAENVLPLAEAIEETKAWLRQSA